MAVNHFKSPIVRGIVFLLGTAFVALAGRALAQNEQEQLPPHVIDVSPFPGEEVLTDQAITVTFDQAMNPASVEAAWQIEPAAPGKFAWPDARTLTFLPDGGWQRATRYTVTIGTGAKAANDLALEDPYMFFVQTIGHLEVSAVIPAPDAEGVTADATITVSFNRPVVPLVSTEQMSDLPRPLQFEPDIDGTGDWVNTSIYVFTPRKALAGGTTYTVSVPAGLTDVTGATLDQTYTWAFKTLVPEILNVTPSQGQTGVLLESTVSIQFSQPMDQPSTEEAFMLLTGGMRVPGTIDWLDNNRQLVFRPTLRLAIDSGYTISVAPSARSASGEATLREGITYSFSTVPYPGIADTSPRNGDQDVYPGGGVTIYFKSPMDTSTFEGKAEIVKPEGVTWEPSVSGQMALTLNFATQPETTYVIRFKRGAEDIYGNAIQTDYTFSFTTGQIQSWASLPSRNRFMITNAYRDNTRIAMSVSGKPTVGFMLYRVDTSRIGLAIRNYSEDVPAITQVTNLVRAWSQELDAGPQLYGVGEVLLASDSGGRLPPGVYYLNAHLPNDNYPQSLVLGVVTANLTVKRAPDETLIWVTDIQSAEPIAGVNVTLYRADGTRIASGETNEDGVLRVPMQSYEDGSDFLYAVAEAQDIYGAWWSWGASSLPDTAGYVYTDRPIYRPGQTVYFRGVVRDRQDMTYTPPNAKTVHVRVDVNWGSQQLLDEDVPLTDFGTFSSKFDLPADVQLGQGTISVHYRHDYDAQVYFTIAEFRVPEYKVDVTPDYSTIVQGDPLKAIIASSYYFGGPVSNANLTWTAHGEPAWFNYTGPGNYNFSDETQNYFSWWDMGSGSATTDTNGQVIVDVANTQAPSSRPMTITVEGTVTDESGQYISGRATVLAHPANVYVGMRTDRYFGRENTPLTVSLIAVTPDSQPLAGQKIDLDVIEIRWERIPIEGRFGQYNWQQKEIEVETGEVTTGSDGTAQYTFTPPQAGIYRVRAVTRDERERVNGSSLRFWVTGKTSVWWGQPSDTIDLVADKDLYQPGDTAEILIPIPFTGTSYVMVTVERAGIQQVQVLKVQGSTLVYDLPITEEHVPTVYVTATLVKGTDEENLNPSYRLGSIALNVEPVNQRLDVTVTPSAALVQPGQTVTLAVKTTDSHGEPVSAEVGVTMTDQAILSLMPPNSSSLEASFYGSQGDYVDTGVALSALLDSMTDELIENEKALRQAADMALPATATAAPTMAAEAGFAAEGGAAPGAPPPVTVRENFQQTPLWAPHVVTDASGQATVSVTLPDNLTTWHVDARGLTLETHVGDAALDVVSTLPLLTRPVTPRFFVVGDRVTLASVINNNTDAPQTVQATLQATGVTLESDATQPVTIESGSRARVEWVAVVQDVPYVDLTFYAVGANGYQDASKPTLATGPDGTIPVYRYTAPDTVGTGGVLRDAGSRTEAISLPPHVDTDQGELTVHVDPSLAVTTVDALDYLINFRHQCIEQTISRFLPNIMTYRALKDLGLSDPELEAKLNVVLNQALTKLANEQNPDGGWGWFGLMRSDPYVTAYAALGLIEARDAGFDIDQSMIDRALNFVRTDFVEPGIDTPVWELNRQAFYLYVLARDKRASQADLNALLGQRLEMDYWARAFLLMAYHEANPADPAVAQLTSDLQTAAILSATGAHWEEKERDWWNWSSDTRSTAIALTALTRTQPNFDLLPNVVRWLMVARQGDHWETTQETAWAVMALTDWMVASGELRGNYSYGVTLNGDLLTQGRVTPDTVRQGEVLRVQVKDLLTDQINRLTLSRGDGEGVLYYTAHLNLRLPAAEVKPISRGITVSREYYLADNPGAPISQARVGDVISVRVIMTLPQDIYYFVLEDPLPAGTEPVDTSLLTTNQSNQPPTVRPAYDPYWYWGWWYFDHTEMHDEEVDLYADFLPSGTYVYTYEVRASVPGEFQTMPSHAYAFYFPEVFGRGAGMLFTVQPAE
jgi:uncharacterized protein YfaS (alpha-2-macroglobulin family)